MVFEAPNLQFYPFVYRASTSVSNQRGVGANLLKTGTKRRRTKAQIAEEKKQEEARLADIASKLAKLAELEAEN